jgi:hypothetical protein
MSEFSDWRSKQSMYTKVQLSGAEQCIDLELIFNAALAIGERRGMERAADMVEAQAIHSDFPMNFDISTAMAEKIRKEINDEPYLSSNSCEYCNSTEQ